MSRTGAAATPPAGAQRGRPGRANCPGAPFVRGTHRFKSDGLLPIRRGLLKNSLARLGCSLKGWDSTAQGTALGELSNVLRERHGLPRPLAAVVGRSFHAHRNSVRLDSPRPDSSNRLAIPRENAVRGQFKPEFSLARAGKRRWEQFSSHSHCPVGIGPSGHETLLEKQDSLARLNTTEVREA